MNEDELPTWDPHLFYRRDLTPTTDIRELNASPRDKYVAKTEVDYVFGGSPMMVSTVFLAIDHNYTGQGRPVLFETMVFGLRDENAEMMDRYCTEDEALAGHEAMVRRVNLHGIRRTTDVFEREVARAEEALGRRR